jgi:phosphatidylserine/phosphatidylglycerophosphate/cardiolipin synthase-like enzyme
MRALSPFRWAARVCLLSFLAWAPAPLRAAQVDAYFMPEQGEAGFSAMYQAISEARSEVLITVYSWSDKDLDRAIVSARANGATVRLVLHPELTDKKPLMDRCGELEKQGAEFKIAPRNMHEKFVLIDGRTLINSSANFSIGARTKYSENIVLIREAPVKLARTLHDEFALLWDASRDLITQGEGLAPWMGARSQLPLGESGDAIRFYSSSFNLQASPTGEATASRLSGKAVSLKLKKSLKPEDQGGAPWAIRDLIIQSIDAAQVSIDCALNHFNIRDIADALLRADARGVKVRLNVDQQEYQEHFRADSIEMTPYFVAEWKKRHSEGPPPVRVKTYSLEPTPAYWLLNHHKVLLMDYRPGAELLPSTRLLTGSYNLSETAEHNQFDNMLVFQGAENAGILAAFHQEIEHLWHWGRTSTDQVDSSWLSRWTTPSNDGTLGLHFSEAQALTWPEMETLRTQVRRVAPGLLEKLNRTSAACSRYIISKKQLVGCPTP